MKPYELHLYTVDMKYIRNLASVDDHVLSVSPQVGKSIRPFLGIVVLVNGCKYCIPLSSPKEKYHSKTQPDFIKIVDERKKDKNIPVDEKLLQKINLKINPSDTSELKHRKGLLVDEIRWCRDNCDLISRKTQRIYDLVTQTPEKNLRVVKRCCDFKKLEKVLDKYVKTE